MAHQYSILYGDTWKRATAPTATQTAAAGRDKLKICGTNLPIFIRVSCYNLLSSSARLVNANPFRLSHIVDRVVLSRNPPVKTFTLPTLVGRETTPAGRVAASGGRAVFSRPPSAAAAAAAVEATKTFGKRCNCLSSRAQCHDDGGTEAGRWPLQPTPTAAARGVLLKLPPTNRLNNVLETLRSIYSRDARCRSNEKRRNNGDWFGDGPQKIADNKRRGRLHFDVQRRLRFYGVRLWPESAGKYCS